MIVMDPHPIPGLWFIVFVLIARPAERQVGSVPAEDFLAHYDSAPRNLTVKEDAAKGGAIRISWLPPPNCQPGWPSSYRYVIIEADEMHARSFWEGSSYRGEVPAPLDCDQPIVHDSRVNLGIYQIRLWASYKGSLGISANATFKTWLDFEIEQGFEDELYKVLPYRSEEMWIGSEPQNVSVDTGVLGKLTIRWQKPASLRMGTVKAYSFLLREDDGVYLRNQQHVKGYTRAFSFEPDDPLQEFHSLTLAAFDEWFHYSTYYRLRMWTLFNGTHPRFRDEEGRPSEPLLFLTPRQRPAPADAVVTPHHKPSFVGSKTEPGNSDLWWRDDAKGGNHMGTTIHRIVLDEVEIEGNANPNHPDYVKKPVSKAQTANTAQPVVTTTTEIEGNANPNHPNYVKKPVSKARTANTLQPVVTTTIEIEGNTNPNHPYYVEKPVAEAQKANTVQPDVTTTSRPRFNGMSAIAPKSEDVSSSTASSAQGRRHGRTTTGPRSGVAGAPGEKAPVLLLSDIMRQKSINTEPTVSASVSEPTETMSFAKILLICMPCIAVFFALLTAIILLFLRVKRK